MKKSIALILLLTLTVAIFCSCTGTIKNDNFKTEGYILVGDKEVVPEYVMKINGNAISLAEYRYYYLNEKADLDGGDENVWKEYPEYVDLLKGYVHDNLVEIYSIRSLADENGVEVNAEQVSKQIKEYKEGLSSSEFKDGLSAYHLTEALYEYILQGYELYNSLFDFYFGENGTRAMTDKEMLGYINDNYTHAKHILINPNTTMSDEDYQSLLDEVAEKAATTDDFDALVAKYSNDNSMPSYGYYFTDEEMPEEFVAACNALEDGEISGLVKSSHGYHVIQKLAVDKNDLSELKDVVYNQIFTEIVDEKIASAKIEYASEYESITPTTLK